MILGFTDKTNEYSFENKVYLVEDKLLVNNLSKTNIKNQNSSMIIKSMNNISIADVVQIKINVAETGHFLASFDKEKFSEEKRNELLENIKTLKSSETPTIESQSKKIQELLGFLTKYEPIYCTFSNSDSIKIEQATLEENELTFPLLVLLQPKKKFSVKIGKQKEPKINKEENLTKTKKVKEKATVNYEPFELFDIDYLFIFIFSLLGSFSITAAVFELMNKKNVAIFLIILGVVFFITLTFAIYSCIYKKNKLRNPWLRYYLVIFVVIGIAAGIVSSFFVCRGILKTEIENFDYKRMMAFAIPISAVSMLSAIELSRVAKLFMKLRQDKKSQ